MARRVSGSPAGNVFEQTGVQRTVPRPFVVTFTGIVCGPKTAVTDERAYLRAFFDKYLRHRDNHLLDGPSPRFPDIQFEP